MMQDILDPKYLATLTDEQFDTLLNSVAQPQKPKPKPYVEPTPPRDMGFIEGNLKKAWGGFGQMAGGALGLVGDLVGSKDIQDLGLLAAEGSQTYNRGIDQKMITPETNLIDTYEKQGLWEAAKATPQFIAEQAVQNLPLIIGTGGVGGFVGKSATKSMLLKELSKRGLAAEALKEGVEKTARKHLSDDVLTSIANKGGLAATGASGAQWSGLESGSIYADQPEDQKDPLKALAYGTAAGMIEPLPEAAAIMRSGLGKKLLTGVGKEGAETYKQAFKNVGVDLLKQAPMEGAQEMVQTGLEQAGAHKDPFTEESFKEQVVGGIAGMGIGGAFGGATSTYQNFPLKKKIVDNKTEVDLTGHPSDLKVDAATEAEELANTIIGNNTITPLGGSLEGSLSEELKPVKSKNIFKQVPVEEDGYAESFEKNLPFENGAYEKYMPVVEDKLDNQSVALWKNAQATIAQAQDSIAKIKNGRNSSDPTAVRRVAALEEDLAVALGMKNDLEGRFGADSFKTITSQRPAAATTLGPQERNVKTVNKEFAQQIKGITDPQELWRISDKKMKEAEQLEEAGDNHLASAKRMDALVAQRMAYDLQNEQQYGDEPVYEEQPKQDKSKELKFKARKAQYESLVEKGRAKKTEDNVYWTDDSSVVPTMASTTIHNGEALIGINTKLSKEAYQSKKLTGAAREQKLEMLKLLGVNEEQFFGLFNNQKEFNAFLLEHEKSHFNNDDQSNYPRTQEGKLDKMSSGAFEIEARATMDALTGDQKARLELVKTKPSVAPKTIFPKKDIVPSSLDVENASEGVQSIVSPTTGSKNLFGKVAQSEGVEVGADVKPKKFIPKHENYYKSIFKNNGLAFDDATKLAVAKDSGYDSFEEMRLDGYIPTNDTINRVSKKQAEQRIGKGSAEEGVERWLDDEEAMSDATKQKRAQKELTKIKRTGKEQDPESLEAALDEAGLFDIGVNDDGEVFDDDAPKLKGKHRQYAEKTEDGFVQKEAVVRNLDDVYKEKSIGLSRFQKKGVPEATITKLKNRVAKGIQADQNKTMSLVAQELQSNKLLSQEEKQEVLEYVGFAKEEELYLPDIYRELKRNAGVGSLRFLRAVPDSINNVEVEDLDPSWGKPAGRQEDKVGKLKSKTDTTTKLQSEQEQQAAAYKIFVDYKVEERQNDIENVYDVLKAIKEIADSGLRSQDSILRAKDVLKKRPMLRGKDQKAKLESVQRIMSGNRLIISGEWVPVYNVSNEWIGLDKVGGEEHTYTVEYKDKKTGETKTKQLTGAIPTEYNVSENVFEISREMVSTSFDPSYAAPLDEADPHEMKRDGIQTIDSGSVQGGGQTAKSYVTKAAIDKMLELGISRGFATEKHREIIEKHNAKIVALQEERDAERQKHGVLNEEKKLRIPKTKTEDKEKYYLGEIAAENRKMVAVLLPIKANMLKAQLKSVFFEDKNFFEKESDRYVSQGFTKEFLHALAKESQYDRTIYESRVNREVQRKNQELADEIFKEVKAGDKDVFASEVNVNSYLFSAGNFTQQERENFAKYDDSIKVKNVDGNTDIVRFIDTLTTQEREKLEIFKALQQRLLDVVKVPKAGERVQKQDAHVKEYMRYSYDNRAEILFTDKEESEKSDLEKSVEQFFATRHPDEKVSLGKLRDQSQQTFFEKFAKVFGAELVVIRDYRERHKQFQGKYFVSKSGKPVIIVNANGTSFGRVFAHELFHHIVNKANPKEYQAFKDAVLANIPENKFEEAIEKARTIWSPYMTKAQAVRIFSTSEFNTSPKRVMSSDNESTARRPEKLEKLVSTIRTKLDDTSSNWSTSTYETGLQSVFPEDLKQELEEEIFAEMFSFAFNTKDFWEHISQTPSGVSLAQKLIKGFVDIINKVLEFFNKNIKQLDNGIFGIKGLVAHDNWFDDIVTGDAPIKGAFSLMYDLMGSALDSNTLNNMNYKASDIDSTKMLPTIEEVKNHIANHATYKKIFPNGINSYKDVMTAIENLLSNLKTWIVKNMPSGVFTHVGASEPVKKIMFSVAHGGMLEAQKAYLEAVEPHAKVFDKMTSLELEAFVDDVTKNGLENVTPEQKEALLAMQKVADETFAKLKKYFPYLQQRENHFGLSIKWLNKDRTLFEDEFEWEAYGSKLEGNKRFMKEKSDLSIAEIREKYNLDYETIHPQKLFLRYIKDAHYLMNFQEQMKDARKEDIARYFTDQKKAMEAGYVPVNDNALKVFQRMGFSDGYKIAISDGTYYSQNETPVYFSSEAEAKIVSKAIADAYEEQGLGVSVEKFTPEKLVKIAFYDIYTEVEGKELFVSSAKTKKEADKIAKANNGYFIKERISSQQDSVIAQMYFKPDMAKMMNSLLSYDGFKNFKAFGISGVQAMDLKNIATSLELSFSMFHAFTIGQESISSYAAWIQGLKKLGIGEGLSINTYNPIKVTNESKKVAKLLAESLKYGNTKEVKQKAKELLGVDNADPLKVVTLLINAGLQLDAQDSDLRGSGADVGKVDYSSIPAFFESFKETFDKEAREFKQKNPNSKIKFGASISWNMFKYVAHASSAWLMEHGIPMFKAAQAARELALRLFKFREEIAAGLMTEEQIAIDVVLFIEDRFGEVNWKNKWLDATYKTSLQFAFRSFTWVAGTYVALGKIMPEYARLGWFKLKGEEYHLTEKGLWGIHVLGAHIFTAALLSSVYTLGAALSGDEQKTDEDTPWLTRMLFPRVDPYDNTRRLSVPSYVTEFYKIATHLGYGGNPVEVTKLISGRFNSLLSKSVELAKNEDFRGTLIRNPKDSIVGQTADVVQHIIPLPISWGTIIKDAQKEGFKPQSVMTGLMGFTDAPASAKRSVAANTAYKISRKEYKGKTEVEENIELKDELSRAMSAYKNGDKSKVEKLLAEGRISTRQFQIVLERTPIINGKPNPVYKDQLEQQVSRLTIDGSLDVWEKMTKNEQNKTRAAIIKKYSNMLSRQDKPREEKKKITEQMKELGIIK